MVELWLAPQLEEDRGNTFFFQENGAPLFHHNVPVFHRNHFPERWSGKSMDVCQRFCVLRCPV
jgi:hypothetical protein